MRFTAFEMAFAKRKSKGDGSFDSGSESGDDLHLIFPFAMAQSPSSTVKDQRTCLCGSKDCAGLTSAFRILGKKDPRSSFHRIPRKVSPRKKDGAHRAAIDAVRKAYVAVLFPVAADRPRLRPREDYFIAKHHFPPEIVLHFQKLPYSLPKETLEQDLHVNVKGWRTLGAYLTSSHPCEKSLLIVPNHSLADARKDLQSLLREEERLRLFQARERLKQQASIRGIGLSSSGLLASPASPRARLVASDSPRPVKRIPADCTGDEPTEATFNSSGSSCFTGSNSSLGFEEAMAGADSDLWYDKSQQISLPPRAQPDRETHAYNAIERFSLGAASTMSTSGALRNPRKKRLAEVATASAPRSITITNIKSQQKTKSMRAEIESPIPEFFLMTAEERPVTAATSANADDEHHQTKPLRVKALSLRRTLKSELKYLMLQLSMVPTRPKTGRSELHATSGLEELTDMSDDGDEVIFVNPSAPSKSSSFSSLVSNMAMASSHNDLNSGMHQVRQSPLAPSGRPISSDDDDSTEESENKADDSTSDMSSFIQATFAVPLMADPTQCAHNRDPWSTITDESDNSVTSVVATSDEDDEKSNKFVKGAGQRKQHGSAVSALQRTIRTVIRRSHMANRTKRFESPPRERQRSFNVSKSPSEDRSTVIPDFEEMFRSSSRKPVLDESMIATVRTEKASSRDNGTQEHQAITDLPDPLDTTTIPEPASPELPDRSFAEEEEDEGSAELEVESEFSRELDEIAFLARENEREEKASAQPQTLTESNESDLDSPSTGGVVTVLDADHLVSLLGGNDDDSDFEEKWEKANKNDPSNRAVARRSFVRETSENPSETLDADNRSEGTLGSIEVNLFDFAEETSGKDGTEALSGSDMFEIIYQSCDVASIGRDDTSSSDDSQTTDEAAPEAPRIVEVHHSAEAKDSIETPISRANDRPHSLAKSPTENTESSPVSLVDPQDDEGVADLSEASLQWAELENPTPIFNTPGRSVEWKKTSTESQEIDRSQSTKDATNSFSALDDDESHAESHFTYEISLGENEKTPSQYGTLSFTETEESNAINTLTSPEEEEEFAYLEMLTVDEEERHQWFKTMYSTLEVEYQAHVQILETMKSESAQVVRLMDYSHQSIDIYSRSISALCGDQVFRQSGGADNCKMMDALIKSYRALSLRLGEKLPALEAIVQEMASYKNDLCRSVNIVQERGLGLLQELSNSEDSVRSSWAILKEASSTAEASVGSKDLWLQEVDYRQSVTRHLSVWRQRATDLKDLTVRILEMEGVCHQRLKNLLLYFLRKRHSLFVGVRDLLDPAVDSLDSSGVLSSIEDINIRLEQAVLHFQPGKKRSRILSLVSSSETTDVPQLDDLSSLAAFDGTVLKKSRNVSSYAFATCKTGESFEEVLAVVTRQHFLHVYVLPAEARDTSEYSRVEEQENSILSTLQSGSPIHSVALSSCTFEQTDACVEIRVTHEKSEEDQEDESEETRTQLRFWGADEAAEWLSEVEGLFSCASVSKEESSVVRI